MNSCKFRTIIRLFSRAIVYTLLCLIFSYNFPHRENVIISFLFSSCIRVIPQFSVICVLFPFVNCQRENRGSTLFTTVLPNVLHSYTEEAEALWERRGGEIQKWKLYLNPLPLREDKAAKVGEKVIYRVEINQKFRIHQCS